jgi:hypothetical protein
LSIELGAAPSRDAMNNMQQLLDGALRRAGLEPASDLWAVLRAWPEAVGTRVAAHAMPIALAREELVIAVPDAVWRQELALLTPEIVDGVNRMIGRTVVRRVRLVGAAATPEPARPARRARGRLAPATDPGEAAPGSVEAESTSGREVGDVRERIAAAIEALVRARTRAAAADQPPRPDDGHAAQKGRA